MLRKGQHLFNEILKRYGLQDANLTFVIGSKGEIKKSVVQEFPYFNLHQILFNLTDREFEEIMESLEK